MIAGHYVTALVPERTPSAARLAFFLVASQLPDLAWFALTFLGLEPMHTHAGPAHLELIVTHDLLPTLPWLAVAALAGRALFGEWRLGWIAAALVAVHAGADLLSGYPHFVAGPDTQPLGFGLYYSAPYVAVALEAVFAALVLGWVVKRERDHGLVRSGTTWAGRAFIFGAGIATSFATAPSLGDLPVNGALPLTMAGGFLALYAAQIAVLTWTESRPARAPSTDAAGMPAVGARPSRSQLFVISVAARAPLRVLETAAPMKEDAWEPRHDRSDRRSPRRGSSGSRLPRSKCPTPRLTR